MRFVPAANPAFWLVIPASLIAAPASAQQPAVASPDCATVRPAALPAGFEGWGTRLPLAAGTAVRNTPVLQIGRGADLRLAPSDTVTTALPPAKAAAEHTNSGLAMFQIARAGTIRVGLGTGAWIELVRGGKSVPSVAHGHGPACTGLRKIVDFRVTPGRYLLQLTGADVDVAPVLIARAAR